jgi:hypothetical protein
MDRVDIERLLVITHSKVPLSDEGKVRMAEGVAWSIAFDEWLRGVV